MTEFVIEIVTRLYVRVYFTIRSTARSLGLRGVAGDTPHGVFDPAPLPQGEQAVLDGCLQWDSG